MDKQQPQAAFTGELSPEDRALLLKLAKKDNPKANLQALISEEIKKQISELPPLTAQRLKSSQEKSFLNKMSCELARTHRLLAKENSRKERIFFVRLRYIKKRVFKLFRPVLILTKSKQQTQPAFTGELNQSDKRLLRTVSRLSAAHNCPASLAEKSAHCLIAPTASLKSAELSDRPVLKSLLTYRHVDAVNNQSPPQALQCDQVNSQDHFES